MFTYLFVNPLERTQMKKGATMEVAVEEEDCDSTEVLISDRGGGGWSLLSLEKK